jgi:predicted nucleotidyltransferase
MQFSEETKKRIGELCEKNGVRELRLFGSRASNDHTEFSDYDLLVEFKPDSGISLFEFSRIQIDLEDLLGAKVDLVTKAGLKSVIRDSVMSDTELIFAD